MTLLLTFLLILMGAPAGWATVGCSEVTSVSRAECEASLLLGQGIDEFQNKDYAAAHAHFQRIIDEYPQAKGAVGRAVFYSAECEKLRPKPAPAKRVLKFKPETNRGQILSPGEKPPSSTLEESQKALTAGTTTAR